MTDKAYPIETCDKCKIDYLCCDFSCGRTNRDNNQTRFLNAGDACPCGKGTMQPKTTRICCRRYNHHIGARCEHCGTMG